MYRQDSSTGTAQCRGMKQAAPAATLRLCINYLSRLAFNRRATGDVQLPVETGPVWVFADLNLTSCAYDMNTSKLPSIAKLDSRIETVYQYLAVAPAMTIAENRFLGRELCRPGRLAQFLPLLGK